MIDNESPEPLYAVRTDLPSMGRGVAVGTWEQTALAIQSYTRIGRVTLRGSS